LTISCPQSIGTKEKFVTTPNTLAVPGFKTRIFLFRSDMNPTIVLTRWPCSRFIAVAHADGMITQGMGLGAYAFGRDVWGIIVETGAEQRGAAVPLTLRDGSPSTAMLVAGPSDGASVAKTLVEANYWELPQAYRDRIKAYIDTSASD
jgi:hypothetical protein